MQKENRKRLAKPKTLVVFGFLFLLLPVVNYLLLCYQKGISPKHIGIVLRHSDIFAVALIFLAIPVGIGLLKVKIWGWRLFLIYAVLLIAYNIQTFFFNPKVLNLAVFLESLLGITSVFYFTRKDISAPFFKMYPRGWRMQKRKPIEIEVEIEGEKLYSTDISSSGIYVKSEKSKYDVNQAVSVRFSLGEKEYKFLAGVVRIDEEGFGIAFRDVSNQVRKELATLVKEL